MRRLGSVLCLLATSLIAQESAPASRPAGVPREVTFKGSGEFELAGTLLMPAAATNERRVAAILLLPGSGPTDRDGNQKNFLTTHLLRDVATHLAAERIATLRFDKRAVHAYKEKWPRGVAELASFFAYEHFVADATAAYRFLRAQEGVDAARVVILGHSEGGLFALQIAKDLAATTEAPAGLILAGTAGRVLDVVLREQITATLEEQTQDEALRREVLDHLDRGIEAARKGEPTPADMHPGLAALFNPSAQVLLRAYFTVDPAVLAASVRGPVLILQGAQDSQISAERDLPLLVAALGKRAENTGRLPSVDAVIVDDASHNFKRARGMGFSGPVVPQALDALASWCRKHLAASR